MIGGVTQRTDAQVLFNPADVTWNPVSPRLARKRLLETFLTTVVALAVTVSIALAWGHWVAWLLVAVVVVLAAWVTWMVPRQVRAIGYAERPDDLLIRRGIMFRSLVVVPYGRMQFVDVEAGPLDRSFRLASLQLHTASAHTDASIPGLEPAQAARLRDSLAARGEARLAGL